MIAKFSLWLRLNYYKDKFIYQIIRKISLMSKFHQIYHKRIKTESHDFDEVKLRQESLEKSEKSMNRKHGQSNYLKNLQHKLRINSNLKQTQDIKRQEKNILQSRNKILISSLSQTNHPVQNNQTNSASKEYEIISMIGKGTFGKILKGYSSKKNKAFAIKKIYQDDKYQNRELDIMKMINHPNIIRLIDHFYHIEGNKKYLYLVMNIYEADLYKTIRSGQIDRMLMKIYLFQILKGLEYLASQLIAHRDLKPHNILINQTTLEVVICDFGSSKRLIKSEQNIAYICARSYRAPELILGCTEYTPAVDMWALGCIMAEMVNKKVFFQSSSNTQQMFQIIKILGNPTKQDYSDIAIDRPTLQLEDLPKIKKQPLKQFIFTGDPELIDLIEQILVFSPKKRYTPTQALNHSYFKPLKNARTAKELQNIYEISIQVERGKQMTKNHFMPSVENEFEPINLKRTNYSDKLQKLVVPRFNIVKQQTKITTQP